MAPKSVCDAHELLIQNIERIQKGQGQLYDLDREKAAELADIKVSLAKLTENMSSGFQAMTEQNELLRKMIQSQSGHKWKPGHMVALAGTFFGSASVVVAAWLQRKQ